VHTSNHILTDQLSTGNAILKWPESLNSTFLCLGNVGPSPAPAENGKGRRGSRLGGHQASAPDWAQRQASHVTVLIGLHLSASLAPNGQPGSCSPILGADTSAFTRLPLSHSRVALQGAIFRAADGVPRAVNRHAGPRARPIWYHCTVEIRDANQHVWPMRPLFWVWLHVVAPKGACRCQFPGPGSTVRRLLLCCQAGTALEGREE
jgi:hypothetical protein